MVDFIIRNCGRVGFLPIIKVVDGKELYRGEHHNTGQSAFNRAQEVWDGDLTGSIKEFKNLAQICFEGCDTE